jgi:hypothetical protein
LGDERERGRRVMLTPIERMEPCAMLLHPLWPRFRLDAPSALLCLQQGASLRASGLE